MSYGEIQNEPEKEQETLLQNRLQDAQEKRPLRTRERRDTAVVPCYHPVQAWQGRWSGKLYFQAPTRPGNYKTLQVPCGKCIGCRLEHSRQWAVRIMHEASMHEDNCFITLTYNDAHLPPDGSLAVRPWQLFMKKLRKAHEGKNIRFYMCGEYGDNNGRPHFHACVFGYDFPDKVAWRSSQANGEHTVYRSPELDRIWGQGFTSVGSLTFESAAYVARYVTKKVSGEKAEAHYQGKKPEFATMSRRPGIGATWFQEFGADVYPHDFVVVNGVRCKPPKFYDRLLERSEDLYQETDIFVSDWVKMERVERSRDNPDTTPERLAVREEVTRRRAQLLKRGLQNDD